MQKASPLDFANEGVDVELVEAAARVRRIEVDQHRYELKALIDSEKRSKGSVRGDRQICLE